MSVSDGNSVSHTVKFDGTNFQIWKFQITIALRQHGLLGVVLRNEKKPEGDDPTLAIGTEPN